MNTIKENAKSIAALVLGIATALLGIYGPDTPVGHALTVAVAIATAVTVWAVPNAEPAVDVKGDHEGNYLGD